MPEVTRRHFLGASAAALLAAHGRTADAPRPNLLLITADDLGCQLSCYGERRQATPRLDALARQGARFDRFYIAQASCSPSRAALLTGRYPHENGQIGLSHLGFTMRPGQPNLPALLQRAGYRTGIIGKLHVEPAAEFPWDWQSSKKTAALPTRDVGWVAQESRGFFASAKQAGRPFFYYANFFDPHGPYVPDADQVGGLPAKPWRAADITEPYPLRTPTEAARRRVTATILNTIARLDAGVGLLLDELERAGLADNTLVVFLGDNGLPVVRGKTWSYEPGVRVPLLVRGPGIAAGQERTDLAAAIDILPTVLSAAGVAPPTGLAGRDLRRASGREFLFTEMNFHEPQILRVQRSVRDTRHKLLLNLTPDPDQAPLELFDLQTDLGESKNLADDAALAPTRARLATALRTWREQTSDPTLDPARVRRWQEAAARWGKLPKKPTPTGGVVCIPAGELALLE
jgi:N-sulfoglucosamine sulfohydrolase